MKLHIKGMAWPLCEVFLAAIGDQLSRNRQFCIMGRTTVQKYVVSLVMKDFYFEVIIKGVVQQFGENAFLFLSESSMSMQPVSLA